MFVYTTTSRTGARGVARINVNDLHAVQPGFVEYLGFQVVKCPAMQGGPMRASNRYPVADAVQVFQANAASSALRLDHDALTEAVVGIVAEAPFFACQMAQQATSRLGSFVLQLAAQP